VSRAYISSSIKSSGKVKELLVKTPALPLVGILATFDILESCKKEKVGKQKDVNPLF